VSYDYRAWSGVHAAVTLRAAAPTSDSDTGADALPPLRVLVADDYPDAAESLAMLFANAGHETRIAQDGEQALALAEQWHPDVCVLDLDMPKIDGCEAARRIREQEWETHPLLIAFSGWTGAEHKYSAVQAGFDHYVMKPVEPQKLMRIIRAFQRTRFR
jgi:CheY-like chemotaxis protein